MSIVSVAVNFIWKNATLETVGKVILLNYLVGSIGSVIYVAKAATDLTCLIGRVVYVPVNYLLSPRPTQPQVLAIEYEEELTISQLTDRIAKNTLSPGAKFRIVEDRK
jgi:hypothetical protein